MSRFGLRMLIRLPCFLDRSERYKQNVILTYSTNGMRLDKNKKFGTNLSKKERLEPKLD